MIKVHQDRGNDLRMLIPDQIGHGRRVHPFQTFNACRVPALQNARNEVRGFVVTECFGQNRANICIGVDMNGCRFFGCLVKLVEHVLDPGARHGFKRGHGVSDFLHLTRAKMLEDFRSMLLTQRDEQNGCLFDALVSRHLNLSIP